MPAFDPAAAIAVGGTVTVYVHYENYWCMKELLPCGLWFQSPPIKAGACSWRLCCFPNGVHPGFARFVSILFTLDSRVAEPVRAQVQFSLLDQAMEPVRGHPSCCTRMNEYYVVGAGFGYNDFIRRDYLESSGHIVDGTFTIRCDITVERAPQLFHLYQHLPVADVAFHVGCEKFDAHRCVLAARAPLFEEKLFSGKKAEDATAADCCVRIDDMLPEVFETFLHFIYTDALPETIGPEQLVIPESLIVVAEAYELPGLKLICEEELCGNVNESTIGKMLRFAVQRRCNVHKKACIEFLKNPPVLEAAMASDDGLFELVAKHCPVLLKELFAYHEDDCMQEELCAYGEYSGII